MTNSFFQPQTVTCPHCRQPFTADAWLIVDADERPDLLQRILADDLHDAA